MTSFSRGVRVVHRQAPCPPVVHRVFEECPPRAFRELISEVTSIDIMRISLAGPCKLCGETLYHRGERQKETA